MSEKGEHKNLHIFVNRKKFTEDDGVKAEMTVDEIARLVGLTADTATVRRMTGDKPGDPLTGTIQIHQAEHFVVTRNAVEGGHEPAAR